MFDPKAIEAFRRHVDMRTLVVAATYCLLGVLLGSVISMMLLGRDNQISWLIVVGIPLLCGVIGYVIGTERAFMLRLHAQMTLFQAHIEANTQSVNGFESAPTRVNPPPRSLLVKAGLRLN